MSGSGGKGPVGKVGLQHGAGRKTRFAGYRQDLLDQAMRNAVPNLCPMDAAKLEMQHPHVVRAVEREYARLMEVTS